MKIKLAILGKILFISVIIVHKITIKYHMHACSVSCVQLFEHHGL